MDLKVFFDEVFVELPNEYYADFEFEHEITVLELSHLGHFFGIGFDNGEIILCDSESGNNRHKYTGHDTQITALAFSNDNRLLASGDQKGYLQISEVLTHQIIYKTAEKEPILSLIFNPLSDKELLIQNGTEVKLINLETKETTVFPEEVSIILWDKKYGFIIVTEKLELKFYNTSIELMGSHKMNFVKKIVFVTISNNGRFLVLINGKGEAFMYNTDDLANTDDPEPDFREIYNKDDLLEYRFTCCVFDRNNEHIIFSSDCKRQCKLFIFEIDNPTPKQELDGPADNVYFLLFHPQQPVIYSCGYSIQMWTPTYENSWEQFFPGFQHLTTNVEYIEKEDEFDIDDEGVHVDTIMREPGEVIDIFTPAYEDPQILLDLPLNIDEIFNSIIESQKQPAPKQEKTEDE